MTPLIEITFAFLFSAGICSLIDKVFWDGSLDYIFLNGFFTFDLKDVYASIFAGLVVIMLLINHQGLRTANDNDVIKDFIKYIRHG